MYVVSSIIDKFLQSVLIVSPGSESTDALVSWFCDNLPQSVYKLATSRSRVNTVQVTTQLIQITYILHKM